MNEIFNLNRYLRAFVRKDFTDEYETNCLKIVNQYKGQSTVDVFEKMMQELNEQLSMMASKVISEKEAQ